TERLADKTKVTADMSWNDIPTCKEQGLPIQTAYQQPRTVFMPGKVQPDAVAYYAAMLKKVSETPEFQNYLKTTSQTGRFVAGDEMQQYIKQNTEQLRPQFEKDGWLVD
ncbi:MAG: tripartite tricarboxylate transporter substrate binding protein, partial [Methylobacterium mesophilicum]|nr:tripartite tricarboxylate transporter substrate binding protein [Methylobacterium mesophilicum]